MDYEVILTIPAKAQLDHIIEYILSEYKNTQAALGILDDAEETQYRLSHVAGGLKLCEDPRLHDLGYRTIHFKRHNSQCYFCAPFYWLAKSHGLLF